MFRILKNHWFAGLIAFVFGLIIISPTLLSIKKTGPNFQGIYPMFNNDEAYYLSLGREVYDGHYNIGNAFIKEYKDRPSLQQSLAEIAFSLEAKLLGFSIPKTYALNDFLLPFLIYILLYSLFFNIINSKIISIFYSSSLFFIFLSYFNRPTNPQFGLPFFLMGILLVWKILSNTDNFKKIVFLNILFGFIFGLLIYIYPFYWSSLIFLYAIFTVLLAFKENKFKFFIKNWFFFCTSSLFMAIPYLYNVFGSIKDPFFIEASIRQGVIYNHFPAAFFNVALMVSCIALTYLVQRNIETVSSLFFVYSMAICGVVINWQNVITGKALQFSSHYYFPIILFAFIIFSVCTKALVVSVMREKNIDLRKFLAVILMGILLFTIVYWQRNDIKGAYLNIISPPDISELQKLVPVMEWFNKNTLKDSVIYTLGGEYKALIPIYTHNNIYQSGQAGMYLMSDDELENRWVIQNVFEDIDADFVIKNSVNIWIARFGATYQNKEVRRKILQFITGREYSEATLIEKKYIDSVLNKSKYFKQLGFEKSLKIYAVDYALLDLTSEANRELANEFDKYGFLDKVFETNEVVIFRVK